MTNPESLAPELHRPVALAHIGAGGTLREVVADAAECVAIAARLGIPAVAALSCRLHLAAPEHGVVVARGTLAARVNRECIVTAEEFEVDVHEEFRVRFVPADKFVESDDDNIDLDADDDLPYQGVHIDLGEAVVEQLALALDPYPRMPGAELPEGTGDGIADTSPFAALARRAREG